MSIKLILFDLDDTLYPEMEFVLSGFKVISKAIEEEFHVSCDYVLNLLLEEFYNDRKLVFNRVMAKLDLYTEDRVQWLITLYRTHKPEIHLYQDAAEVLPILRSRFCLGMITDGYPLTQRLKVEALGIEKYFHRIVYTWEKGKDYSKPSPQPFVDVVSDLALTPKEAIYVGDNLEKDFKGPRAIGMKSVQILRDGIYKNAVAPKDSYYPDYQIMSLMNLISLVENLD